MNKTRHTKRLGVVALLGVILGAGILFAGCEKPPETVKQPVAKVETKAPAAPTPAPTKVVIAEETPEKQAEKAEGAPPAATEATSPATSTPAVAKALLSPQASETDVLAAIEASADPFQLYALQQEIAQLTEQSKSVRDAVEKKWQEVEASNPPQNLINGLDFVALSMKPAGEGKAEFSVLLRTTADIDTDYQLTIAGSVDPSHKSKLSEAARTMRDREVWSVLPWDYKESEWKADDMSKWKAGEYHMLSCTGACAPIPYNLSMGLQIWDNGRWVSNEGEMIKLGWHAAIDE